MASRVARILSLLPASSGPGPSDLPKLECAVHLCALEFGLDRIPNADFAHELHDAAISKYWSITQLSFDL